MMLGGGHWPIMFDLTSRGAEKLASYFRRTDAYKKRFKDCYK